MILNLPSFLLGGLLLAAAVSYVLRSWERITPLLAALFTALLALWLWRIDLSEPLRELPFRLAGMSVIDLSAPLARLGFELQLVSGALPILVTTLLLTSFAFVLAGSTSQGRTFVPMTLTLVAGYVVLALLSSGPLPPSLLAPIFLVGLTSLGVFVLQAGRLDQPVGPLRLLIPPTLGFPFFLGAFWFINQIPLNPQDTTPAKTAAQLLALGILLLLAPVPLHAGQPATAQSSPPVVTALLTLLYELAVLHLIYRVISTFPFVSQEAPLGTWFTWFGIATAVWGGIAAAGANHAGRIWGYTALHDWGVIIMVLAVPGARTWPLVLFLFGLRAVSMMTAAAGLSVVEQHASGLELTKLQGVGSRLPWNSAALLIGGLGLAGFPLSAGFTGHWAALQLVAETDWQSAAIVLLASGGAIFGYVRMARSLFGPLENRYLLREQPFTITMAVITLVLSISLALAPQLLDGTISRALPAFSG